jgi:hypothetical protein
MIPLSVVTNLVTGVLNGPVSKALDGYIKDVELRRKLEADLQQRLMGQMGKLLEQETAIILAEVNSEHWLTRSWRPVLMLTLLGFVLLVGALLPLLDAVVGAPVPFNPRWQALPPQFWEFLSIGVGGYIGGRSLEKIAAQVLAGRAKK